MPLRPMSPTRSPAWMASDAPSSKWCEAEREFRVLEGDQCHGVPYSGFASSSQIHSVASLTFAPRPPVAGIVVVVHDHDVFAVEDLDGLGSQVGKTEWRARRERFDDSARVAEMEQVDDEFLRERLARLRAIEVDGVDALGLGGIALRVVALDHHEPIALDARHLGDRQGVRVELIYKSAGSHLPVVVS